jgi:hypothetical protein
MISENCNGECKLRQLSVLKSGDTRGVEESRDSHASGDK